MIDVVQNCCFSNSLCEDRHVCCKGGTQRRKLKVLRGKQAPRSTVSHTPLWL